MPATSPHEERSPRTDSVRLALVALSAGTALWIELRFFDLRIFYHWDVWLSADPNTYLQVFAIEGDSWLRHVALGPLVYDVVELLALALGALGLTDGTAVAVRIWLALLVVPAAAAVRTLLLFEVFRRLTDRAWVGGALCLLDIAAFATVTIGAVPESYPLSAACIAAMYWLMTEDTTPRPSVRVGLWATLGALATGITTTNVLPFVVLFGIDLYRRRAPMWASSVTAAKTLALSAAIFLTYSLVHPFARSTMLELDAQGAANEELVRVPSGEMAGMIAWSMGHTFIAPPPVLADSWTGPERNADYLKQITYYPPYTHTWSSWWRALVTMAVIALGIVGHSRHRNAVTWLAAPLLVLAGNFGLHLFFGDEFILYAMHWTSSMVLLVGGLALLSGRLQRVGSVVLALFVALTVANSWILLSDMLQLLELM